MNFMTIPLIFILFYIIVLISVVNTDSGVCYHLLGCFNITEDFKSSPIYRPINLLPESPQQRSTRILFYTRNNKNEQVINKKWFSNDKISDKLDNFDGKKETKFIIHGFLDSIEKSKWMIQMKNEFLKKGDYNVFIVDWSDWNGMPYSQAVANCRVVGAQLALLIKNLNNYHKLKYYLVHLCGHSLGAQLAGYAGKEMAKYSAKIGRLTALDPAGPYFLYMPASVRVDRKDAEFVDVLHTDSNSILGVMGLGMAQSIGHFDFYPNGGFEQPGCTQDSVSSFLSGSFMGDRAGEFVACNHMRSIDYFIESINENECQFRSYSCESWRAFNSDKKCTTCGKSGDLCSSMGFNAIQWKKFKSNKKSKIFYLKTSSSKPYCVYQMKVEVPVSSIGDKSGHYSGDIKLKMISESNTTFAKLEELNITSENSYSSVITLNDKRFYSSLNSIELEWNEVKFDVFNPNTWKITIFNPNSQQNNNINKILFIKQINIKPLFPGVKTKRFCSKNPGNGIKPEKVIKFDKNC